MSRSRIIGLALLCHSAASIQAAGFEFWAADGMTRIFRDTRPEPVRIVNLHAARGEREPFQVVVTGDSPTVRGTTIRISELRNETGGKLPAPAIFRERYVRVSASTPMSPLPPGDYPDALVPARSSFAEKPEPLPSGTINQPWWIDVSAPRSAKPGVYSATITATAPNREAQAIELRLNVWSFQLPLVPKLRSQVGTVWRDVARVHGFDPDASKPSPALASLLDAYADLLAEHRLSIDHSHDGFPDSLTGEFDEKKTITSLQRHFLNRHAANSALPLWPQWPFADPLGADRERAMAYAARWATMADKLGCGSRIYAYFGDLDEPHLSESYDLVRKWGAFFNETEQRHGVRLPFFVTEKPTPHKAEWGSLNGAVDIWVVLCEDVWTDLEGPDPKREIARQIAKGREVWTYPALVQIPNGWLKQRGWPQALKEGNAPSWILDFPPMNYRILGWLMPRHGITGFSYWDTIHRAHEVDVWAAAGNFINKGWDEKIYNGDGLLIYPATKSRHGLDAPLPSIRLKWAREMCDDYDYLMLAAEQGWLSEALRIASSFARGFGDWNDNTAALYEARRQIGERLSRPGRELASP